MKAVSKYVFVMLISLPALASASYETLSFSCSSNLVVSQVPEPTNLSMLAIGLFGIGLLARLKANKL